MVSRGGRETIGTAKKLEEEKRNAKQASALGSRGEEVRDPDADHAWHCTMGRNTQTQACPPGLSKPKDHKGSLRLLRAMQEGRSGLSMQNTSEKQIHIPVPGPLVIKRNTPDMIIPISQMLYQAPAVSYGPLIREGRGLEVKILPSMSVNMDNAGMSIPTEPIDCYKTIGLKQGKSSSDAITLDQSPIQKGHSTPQIEVERLNEILNSLPH